MRRLVFVCALLLCSCRTVRVIEQVPVEVHDTTYVAKTTHDSTYIDRWHTVEVKGDTVFATDIRVESKYVTRYDTVYKSVEKPVTITTTKTLEVAKPLKWWQRTLIYIGIGAVVLLVLWVLWKVLLRRCLPTKLPTKKSN